MRTKFGKREKMKKLNDEGLRVLSCSSNIDSMIKLRRMTWWDV